MPWLFHIGSLALAGGDDSDAWENLFNKLSDKGVITSIDPNVRANLIPDPVQYIKRIERMIKKADILKLSDEDIAWLYPNLSIDEAFDHICSIAGSGIKVMTKGAEGAVAKVMLPVFQYQVIRLINWLIPSVLVILLWQQCWSGCEIKR